MTRARFLTLADICLGVRAFLAHENGAITTMYHQRWRYYGFHVSLRTRRYRQRSAEQACMEPRSLIAARHARFLILAGVNIFSYPTKARRVRRLTTNVNGTLSSCIPIPPTMTSRLQRVRLCRAAEADSSITCAIPNPCRDLSRRRSFCFNSREGHGYDD